MALEDRLVRNDSNSGVVLQELYSAREWEAAHGDNGARMWKIGEGGPADLRSLFQPEEAQVRGAVCGVIMRCYLFVQRMTENYWL